MSDITTIKSCYGNNCDRTATYTLWELYCLLVNLCEVRVE